MSATTVRFRGSEFVANDLPIEVWLLEVVRQIDNEKVVESWLKDLRDEWHLQATSGFGFGVSPALDDLVTTDARKDELVHFLLLALESLAKRSSMITPEELYH